LQDKLWALNQLRSKLLFESEVPGLALKLKVRTGFGSEIEIPEKGLGPRIKFRTSFGSEVEVPRQVRDPNLNLLDNHETATVGPTCNPRLERHTKFQVVKIRSSWGTLIGICSARDTLLQMALHEEF
jgi:hypothetical protein